MARLVETTITFPYRRSLGPVIGAFMTALTERRILGIRCAEQVLVPPMEWDPATGSPLAHDMVEVGPVGTVESWTWVGEPTEQHPLAHPFAFAFIRLDGATTALLHAVDTGEPGALHDGARVAPRWRGARVGRINDIVCFVPGETPEVEGDDLGPSGEPIEMMDYNARITYRNPVPAATDRTIDMSWERKLIGLRCPTCQRTYVGGRGYCPIDSIELGIDTEVELPHTGTITNFVVVTPTPYPGQTETEPFARVFVLIDGTDVVLGYQATIELPVDELRVGQRVAAVWASPGESIEAAGGMGQSLGALIGWMPTDEADNTDADLVNRIF